MTSLFDFAQSSDTEKWQIVNDGVMGGRSSSQASIVNVDAGGESKGETSVMRFAGNLSLENNGGFASVRSRPSGSLGLDPGETIVLRVKGDGRRYTFNLYTPIAAPRSRTNWSSTQKPVSGPKSNFPSISSSLIPTADRMPNMKLTPSQVQSVGILLGDKKPGPFEILVDSIVVQ